VIYISTIATCIVNALHCYIAELKKIVLQLDQVMVPDKISFIFIHSSVMANTMVAVPKGLLNQEP
jgi:hypothetical protein